VHLPLGLSNQITTLPEDEFLLGDVYLASLGKSTVSTFCLLVLALHNSDLVQVVT